MPKSYFVLWRQACSAFIGVLLGGGFMDNIGWNRFSETKISNQVTLVWMKAGKIGAALRFGTVWLGMVHKRLPVSCTKPWKSSFECQEMLGCDFQASSPQVLDKLLISTLYLSSHSGTSMRKTHKVIIDGDVGAQGSPGDDSHFFSGFQDWIFLMKYWINKATQGAHY